jgi:type II secretory pathway pseudopilin PulG
MRERGFTFIEIVIGVAIFIVVALGVYQGYRALYASLESAHIKIIAADIINEQFETIRNQPYTSIGSGGNTIVRDGFTWMVTTAVRSVDDPFDGSGAADSKPADYKLVEVGVACTACKNFTPLAITGMVAPKDLEP